MPRAMRRPGQARINTKKVEALREALVKKLPAFEAAIEKTDGDIVENALDIALSTVTGDLLASSAAEMQRVYLQTAVIVAWRCGFIATETEDGNLYIVPVDSVDSDTRAAARDHALQVFLNCGVGLEAAREVVDAPTIPQSGEGETLPEKINATPMPASVH